MHPVSNVAECETVMFSGWKNRSVGATLMNADSSRSHSIFSIYLEACDTGNAHFFFSIESNQPRNLGFEES